MDPFQGPLEVGQEIPMPWKHIDGPVNQVSLTRGCWYRRVEVEAFGRVVIEEDEEVIDRDIEVSDQFGTVWILGCHRVGKNHHVAHLLSGLHEDIANVKSFFLGQTGNVPPNALPTSTELIPQRMLASVSIKAWIAFADPLENMDRPVHSIVVDVVVHRSLWFLKVVVDHRLDDNATTTLRAPARSWGAARNTRAADGVRLSCVLDAHPWNLGERWGNSDEQEEQGVHHAY